MRRAREKAAVLWNDPRRRRYAYAALAVLLAVLALFPQPYVARTKMVPQDSSSIGLGSMMNALGGQFQSFAAMFGGAKLPIDMYLAIGRSTEVQDDVIARLKLVGPQGYADARQARMALARKVDVHSLTGGIIEVEVRTHDAREAEAITAAYVGAISHRIAFLGRDKVRRKQDIVRQRFGEAVERVAKSEAALNSFRRRNRLAEPEAELGAALSLRAGLEAQLQAKQVELQTLRQFQGAENPQLLSVEQEVASLRAQIAQAARTDSGGSVAGLAEVSGEYLNLYRDYRFAQALYEVYARSSEEVAVEALAGEAAASTQLIEAPRLDADRKVNIPALALLALVLLAALFSEIYAPATGIDLRIRRGAARDGDGKEE